MDFILAFAVGCAAFLLLLKWVNRGSRLRKEHSRMDWDISGPEPLNIKSAGITGDMGPLFRRLDLQDAKITVVAGDGSYLLSKKGKYLEAILREWISHGAKVTYLLLNPSARASEAFTRLSAKIATGTESPGSFSVTEFDSSRCSEDARLLFEEWATHHPTILETSDGPALWLEGFHPEDSIYAYNVQFIPPAAANANGVLAEKIKSYKSKVETLQSYCQ